MAIVRTLQPCYFERSYRVAGSTFEYHGPKQSFLQLVSGSWEKTPEPARPARGNDDLEDENAQLRKLLEANGITAKVPTRNLGKIPSVSVVDEAQEAAAVEAEPADPEGETFDPLAEANAPVGAPKKRTRGKGKAKTADSGV